MNSGSGRNSGFTLKSGSCRNRISFQTGTGFAETNSGSGLKWQRSAAVASLVITLCAAMKTTVLVMEQTKRHSEIRKQKARIKTSPKGPSAPVSVCCYELYMLTFVLFSLA